MAWWQWTIGIVFLLIFAPVIIAGEFGERGRIERELKKTKKGPIDFSRSGGHGRMKPTKAQDARRRQLEQRLREIDDRDSPSR